MSFLGPDSKLKPGWKQGWWWRERVPAIIAIAVVGTLVALAAWLPFYFDDRDDDSGARSRDTANDQTANPAPSGPTRPTEKPPELPDEARSPTPQGIEATIRFEIDAINYAQRTGDFGPVKSVYNMAECKYCKLLVERLSASLQNGARYVGAEYSITSIKAFTSIGDSGGLVGDAIVSEQQTKEGILLDSEGKELERRPADLEINGNYALKFISGKWVIQEEYPRSSS